MLEKIEILNLNNETLLPTLSEMLALPYMPRANFPKFFQVMQRETDLIAAEHPGLLDLMSFMRLVWSEASSKISCFDKDTWVDAALYRCEFEFRGIFEVHLPVWTFMSELMNHFLLYVQ